MTVYRRRGGPARSRSGTRAERLRVGQRRAGVRQGRHVDSATAATSRGLLTQQDLFAKIAMLLALSPELLADVIQLARQDDEQSQHGPQPNRKFTNFAPSAGGRGDLWDEKTRSF